MEFHILCVEKETNNIYLPSNQINNVPNYRNNV